MLENAQPRSASSDPVLAIIGEVRNRWRLKLALRGVLRAGIVAGVLLIAAAYGIEQARFSPASVWAARGLLVASLLASGYWFLFRPLRRHVSDDTVALYLEENEPSLQATLLSAVEASRAGNPESAALVRRVVEQAVEACSRVGASRRVEQAPLRGYTASLAAVALVAAAVVLTGPAFIRQALSAMFMVTRVQAAVPYSIEVKPGNTSVPKGSDQTIVATLLGFESEDATLMTRRADGKFEPIPLVRTESGTYEAMLFDVNVQLDYYVEADGVRTPVFTMKVVEVPYAQRIALEFRFPAYTGLEPQKIEDGGDVAVLKGTQVRVQVFPTMKTTAGRLAFGENNFAELAPQPDGSLVASFTAERDGFYHVELAAPNGERVTASPQYTVDVLEDGAPTVSFIRPGRDTTASAVEEVFVEAKAEDDFGVRDLELVYSVNGGEEKVVKLFGGQRRLPEVSAGHTFYMEELGVQVGDSVSYYARAMDNDGAAGAKRATSDLYFLRVRPFSKDFRQAQSQGGGGGGGGGGGQNQVQQLSEQQRQIISATFNVQRDRKTFTPDKLKQSSNVVALSQGRLREQVEGLITRMNSQLVQQDPAFAKIAELMPQAVAAMKEAEGKLAAVSPDTALAHEHKALQLLQKAEEEYELQVSAGQGGGGGGGGGGAMQQELAEIFDQELDKMASRYETANQAMQQEGDRQVDELLEKLKELARRQEQEAERQRRRALEGGQQQGGGGGGGGGAGSAQQRALAEQVEEAARRLERLAREEERQDLADAARQMREAADAMRKAAAGGDGNASAQAQAALERLRETERRLQRGQTQRAERDIQQAKAQADDIARRQQEIADQAKQLAPTGATERAQQSRQINEKKDTLDQKLGELEAQLDRASRDAAGDEKAASRKMADAAGAIRDNRLRDKVRYSRQLVSRSRNQNDVNSLEADIAGGIDELRQRLDEAESAIGQGATNADNKKEQALDRARRLARGTESLAERTKERAQQGQQGQQDRNAQQQGRDGQQQARNGQQNGRQGQGQQGQNGQQGQGQRGQGQGQGQGQGEGQGQGDGQGDQNGQQGGGGQGGDNRGGSFTNGGFDRGGAWNGGSTWGGWWDGRNARLTPEDVRQLRNDARQYLNDARDLRGQLRGQDIDPRELDSVMNALRELEDDRVYQNVSELVRLQTAVAEGLKRFEFDLRRKVDGDRNQAALSSTDDVPAEFRPLVEQYYPFAGESTAVIWRSVVVAGLVLGLATAAAAQFGFRGFGPRGAAPRFPTADTFGKGFNFCRAIYRSVRGEAGGQGWSTDYPDAELNFSIRLSELTKTRVPRDAEGDPEHLTIRLTDKELYQCPYLHMEDVGTISFNDVEAEALRTYLLKGGFVWVDDFWGSYAWESWTAELARVLPPAEYPIQDVSLDHPIFKSQLQVKEFPQIPSIQSWRRNPYETSERGEDSAEPHARAIFDTHGNVMVFMTHNTDISDAWEREGEDPRYFYQFSPYGYAVGINVILYAMTH